MRPAKTQICLGIRSVWSESSLSAWRKFRSLATHYAPNEDSNRTGRMPRLIWVFAGRTVILLVLSWGGANVTDIVLKRRRGNIQNNKVLWPLVTCRIQYDTKRSTGPGNTSKSHMTWALNYYTQFKLMSDENRRCLSVWSHPPVRL